MKLPIWVQAFLTLLVVSLIFAGLMLRAVDLSIGAVVIFAIILMAVLATGFMVAFGLAMFMNTPGFQERTKAQAAQEKDELKKKVDNLEEQLAKFVDYTTWLEAEVQHLQEWQHIRQTQAQRRQSATGAFPRHFENGGGGQVPVNDSGNGHYNYDPQRHPSHRWYPRGQEGQTGVHRQPPQPPPIDYAPLNNGTFPAVDPDYAYDYHPQRPVPNDQEEETAEAHKVPPRPSSLPPQHSIRRKPNSLYHQPPPSPDGPARNGRSNVNGRYRL